MLKLYKLSIENDIDSEKILVTQMEFSEENQSLLVCSCLFGYVLEHEIGYFTKVIKIGD